MIPLRGTESLTRFPYSTLVLCVVLLLAHFLSYLWPGTRLDFLLEVAAHPKQWDWRLLSSGFFYPHLFSLLVGLIYLWVFAPRVIERRGILLTLGISLLSLVLSVTSFFAIHPQQGVSILAPEAFVGCLLGLFMRRDIWGSVTTLVIGPGWLRVFEVPSYVLLFFWFFYLLLGNLFLEAPFSEAPMLYWLPFSSFLLGFVFESLCMALGELLKKLHNN